MPECTGRGAVAASAAFPAFFAKTSPASLLQIPVASFLYAVAALGVAAAALAHAVAVAVAAAPPIGVAV